MDGYPATLLQAMADRIRGEADLEGLLPSDEPVLSCGESGAPLIEAYVHRRI